nr:transposase, MuDR, MULE transposase domain protein [Tanacetum cinerariifolium]
MHHRNATTKLLGRLLESKFKDNTIIYKGNDIKQDIYTDINIDISYKQAWRAKNVALEYISGYPVASFAQLPYYCHNLKLTNDGTVTRIETVDEDRFKMVFIAFGVVIRSFKYHMRPLIIIDVTHLKGRYEGINLLAVGMNGNNQIIPIAIDGPLDELSGWAKAKIRKRMQKSLNWVAVGRVYEVDDHRRIQIVEFCNGTRTCRKWQVLGLPCGHVLAICRVIGLRDCHRLAKGWFMRIVLKGTYQELVFPVGGVSSWQIPNYLPVVKPPHMDKQPSGRPKSIKHIDLKVWNQLQSDVEGAGRVVTTDKGVEKPFHTQKKGHILKEAHSKQMTTYRNQCSGLSMLSTWMTFDATYFMFLNEWKDNNVINLGFLGRHLLE